jgi:hypothetical protein
MPSEKSRTRTEERAAGARPPALRACLWLVGGAAAVYLATWLPPLSFFWFFQHKILAQGEDPAMRSVLWEVPEVEAGEREQGWPLLDLEGLMVARPPGKLGSVKQEQGMFSFEIDGRAVRLQGFPAGFISSLLEERLEITGGAPEGRRSDAETLLDVVRETPENYRFGWAGRERTLYASRLLTKMLLLEPEKIQRARLVRCEQPPAAALAVEYENGKTKLVTADSRGVLVILLDTDAPAAWKSPASWLR